MYKILPLSCLEILHFLAITIFVIHYLFTLFYVEFIVLYIGKPINYREKFQIIHPLFKY